MVCAGNDLKDKMLGVALRLDQRTFWAAFKIIFTYFTGFWIEPMSDISASCQNKWITKFVIGVVLNEPSEVKDLIEKRDPTIIFGIMKSYFRR